MCSISTVTTSQSFANAMTSAASWNEPSVGIATMDAGDDGVRVQGAHAHAHGRGRDGEHPAELPAAEDAHVRGALEAVRRDRARAVVGWFFLRRAGGADDDDATTTGGGVAGGARAGSRVGDRRRARGERGGAERRGHRARGGAPTCSDGLNLENDGGAEHSSRSARSSVLYVRRESTKARRGIAARATPPTRERRRRTPSHALARTPRVLATSRPRARVDPSRRRSASGRAG